MATIITCDLCGVPIKESETFYLCVLSYYYKKTTYDNPEDYYRAASDIAKSAREICPECNITIERIFELKKANLAKLCDDFQWMYDLDTRTPTHEKKKRTIKKEDEDNRGNE